ncbi:MAG: cupin domain-containing protein [Mariprofundus sp.]
MKLVELDVIEKGEVSHAPDITRQVLLSEHDLPASVRLSHAILRPTQCVAAHSHADLCEVFYVLSGKGELNVDGHCHQIHAGSCFMVEAGEEHALLNNGDANLCLLYFGLNDACSAGFTLTAAV